ncbi:MAG: DUF971 domain-containing protein [Pseudomonadales bacterium]|jgi:DUF971 family protein|nr:DUF971 domain-containing protein [Pseudomonadales bacterium]
MSRVPRDIRLHRRSRLLELVYEDGSRHEFSCEFLRVQSPSAEVRGHGPGQGVLQTGKKYVNIERVEPVGHYALRLVFDDGHDSGIYSWTYLDELGRDQEALWRRYLEDLERANASRLPPVSVARWTPQ